MKPLLKKILHVWLPLLAFICAANPPVFRWDVKTLTDNSGIDWMAKLESAKHAHYASIEGLTVNDVQFSGCSNIGMNTRRSDEKRVVKMRVRLISVKKEGNDNDYHVVMQSLTDANHFMVAEIPDPFTPRLQGSQFADLRQRFTDLREQVKTLLGKNISSSPKNFLVIRR